MTTYQHTQSAGTIVWALGSAAFICALLAFISPVMRVALIVAIPLALTAWLFSRLTVSIDEGKLRASFGPGFIYKDVALDQIDSAEPVRTTWLYGCGAHFGRYGWLYNVAIGDAVAIKLRNGKRLAIGTDQPVELASAIRSSASAR